MSESGCRGAQHYGPLYESVTGPIRTRVCVHVCVNWKRWSVLLQLWEWGQDIRTPVTSSFSCFSLRGLQCLSSVCGTPALTVSLPLLFLFPRHLQCPQQAVFRQSLLADGSIFCSPPSPLSSSSPHLFPPVFLSSCLSSSSQLRSMMTQLKEGDC